MASGHSKTSDSIGSLIFPLQTCKKGKKLLSAHQFGFWASDTCVDQFLSIVHNIYTAFDAYPILESCGVFFDMSKAFDKVWHEWLIFKLRSMGICDALLDLIGSSLEKNFKELF